MSIVRLLRSHLAAVLVSLYGVARAAEPGRELADTLQGLALLSAFVLVCYLVVHRIRRAFRRWHGKLDDPQGDQLVRLGTSISRPPEER